ncbi:hypothetical protein [Iningainema tapete]|uniref:Uncharacterized protein n=1 Tax=Iningainema tapete BLCC-T55 TaxID=2748662 RepID=A0A8J6XG55_9CYAN|nr:hypothetical protein [Iningainema tapete]MBD2771049.1 hypothetical protein [Iningainema tapete BLCC-T55]
MPNWSAIEASFLRQPHQQQLGELAASLARLKSWSQKSASCEIVPVLLEENLLYIKLIQEQNYIAQLSQIQDQLIEWQRNWLSICDRSTEIANLATLAAAWSDWVLDMSGLLVAAESMSA